MIKQEEDEDKKILLFYDLMQEIQELCEIPVDINIGFHIDYLWHYFARFLLSFPKEIRSNVFIQTISKFYFKRPSFSKDMNEIMAILFLLKEYLEERKKQCSLVNKEAAILKAFLSDKKFLNDVFQYIFNGESIWVDFEEVRIIQFDDNWSLEAAVEVYIHSMNFFIDHAVLLFKYKGYPNDILFIKLMVTKLMMARVLEGCYSARSIVLPQYLEGLERMNEIESQCMKDRQRELSDKVDSQQTSIYQLRKKVQKLEANLVDLQEQFQNEKAQLKEQFQNEKAQLKEQFQNENAQLKEKFQNENAQLKEKFQNENAQLKEKFSQLKEHTEMENAKLKEHTEMENAKLKEHFVGENAKIQEDNARLNNLILDMKESINELILQNTQANIRSAKDASMKRQNESLNRRIVIRKFISKIINMVIKILNLNEEKSLLKEFEMSKLYLFATNTNEKWRLIQAFKELLEIKNELNIIFHNKNHQLTEPSSSKELMELINEEFTLSEESSKILEKFLTNLTGDNYNDLKNTERLNLIRQQLK